MKILSREEATKVERSGGYNPWVWPEPVNVAISDSWSVLPVIGLKADNGDPLEFAYAVRFFENLYKQGYAIVKLDPSEVSA